MKSGREQRIEANGQNRTAAPNIYSDNDGYLRIQYKSKWIKGLSWTLIHAQARLALVKANELKATYEDLRTKADAARIIALRHEAARNEKRLVAIETAHRRALDATYLKVHQLEEIAAAQNIKPWEV